MSLPRQYVVASTSWSLARWAYDGSVENFAEELCWSGAVSLDLNYFVMVVMSFIANLLAELVPSLNTWDLRGKLFTSNCRVAIELSSIFSNLLNSSMKNKAINPRVTPWNSIIIRLESKRLEKIQANRTGKVEEWQSLNKLIGWLSNSKV